MRLNPEFLMQDVGDQMVLVPTGAAAERLRGIVQLNETAAFIARQLANETTEEAIVQAMAEEYEGTAEQFVRTVEKTLAKLREAGAIAESN